MKYNIISNKEAEEIKFFLSEDIYEQLSSDPGVYVIAACEDGKVLGTACIKAEKAARIIDIAFLPGQKRILSGLMNAVMSLCMALKCEGIVFEVYDEDDMGLWGILLPKLQFVHTGYQTCHRFRLWEFLDSKHLYMNDTSNMIVSLDEATPSQKKNLSNTLIQKKLFDHVMDPDISGSLSTVFIRNNVITGCVLISEIDGEGQFNLDYLYVDDKEEKTLLLKLISETALRINGRYPGSDPFGYAIATNEKTRKLIEKLFPGSEEIDHINSYALAFDSLA